MKFDQQLLELKLSLSQSPLYTTHMQNRVQIYENVSCKSSLTRRVEKENFQSVTVRAFAQLHRWLQRPLRQNCFNEKAKNEFRKVNLINNRNHHLSVKVFSAV